jgi:hypothetical protein
MGNALSARSGALLTSQRAPWPVGVVRGAARYGADAFSPGALASVVSVTR